MEYFYVTAMLLHQNNETLLLWEMGEKLPIEAMEATLEAQNNKMVSFWDIYFFDANNFYCGTSNMADIKRPI